MDVKIGLLGLTLELYRQKLPELIKRFADFHIELEHSLKDYADIISFRPVSRKSELRQIFQKLEKEDIAGLIIVLLSYSPSLLVLPFLKKFKGPILIWNTQKLSNISKNFGVSELLENHGMHGVQDLTSVLLRESRPFSLVTGHYKDKNIITQIKDWIIAASSVYKLRKSRIGNLGETFPLMGDFVITPIELKKNLGVEVVPLVMKEIANIVNYVTKPEIEKAIREDLRRFTPKDLSSVTHKRSIKLEVALRKIIKKKNLQGIAVNFEAFNNQSFLETVPFLAVSKFLSEGMGYGGEGDTLTASSVLFLQYLAGQANFVEMFTIDFKNNLILMNHMAESNPAMARKDQPILIKENSLPFNRCKPAAVLSFTLQPGIATLVNFTQTKERQIKIIMSQIDIVDRLPLKGIDSPHFFIKVPDKVENFLTRYSCEGGTHHLALAYGDQRQRIRTASEILRLQLVEA